jgi:hypothetical protein
MVGDNEILGGITDTLQQFSVGHEINRHKFLVVQLRILPPQVSDSHPVHVTDSCPGRNLKRIMEGADLDTVSPKIEKSKRVAVEEQFTGDPVKPVVWVVFIHGHERYLS